MRGIPADGAGQQKAPGWVLLWKTSLGAIISALATRNIEDELEEEASGLGVRGATEDVVEEFAREVAWAWYEASPEQARELVGRPIQSIEPPQEKHSRAKRRP